MAQNGVDKANPVFEITAARISDDDAVEKKHIIYKIQIRHASGIDDSFPSSIERRYTNFHCLYNELKREHPSLMSSVVFPKKVLLGNFEHRVISERISGFQEFLKHISSESKLRSSNALLKFLQEIELNRVKKILSEKGYSTALPLLENNFRLLNKIYTDRSPVVILALCRVLGCSILIPGLQNAQKWSDLMLHRFEGVSDSDLLQLYVPLLQVCIKVYSFIDRNKDGLENRLVELKRQGVTIKENVDLLGEVEVIEKRLFSA